MLSKNIFFLNDGTSVYLCIIGSGLDLSPNKFFIAQQSLVGQGLLIVGASKWHSIRHNTFGRTTRDEWSARNREPCVTTHSTHKRQTSMSPTDYYPQSQQGNGRRLTPQTAWPLGSAVLKHSPPPKLIYLSNLGKIHSVGCVLTMYGEGVTRWCVSHPSIVK
jgi:hypothetical protein